MNHQVESSKTGHLREKVAAFVESKGFVSFITVLIIFNAVTLGLETDNDIAARYGKFLHAIDVIVLGVFCIELLLKFYAYGGRFFRSGWNVFDFLIVAISLLPTHGAFAILRALRVLRVLRLLSVVPQMRRVISALAYSLPGMGAVISVLLVIFYVASVLANNFFENHPDPVMQEYFGTIGAAAFTLFEVMTLENWADGIVRPLMTIYPWAWAFFLPFIIVTSFAVLNLFIGIIVDAMGHVTGDENKKDRKPSEPQQDGGNFVSDTHARLVRLERQQQELLRVIKRLEKRRK